MNRQQAEQAVSRMQDQMDDLGYEPLPPHIAEQEVQLLEAVVEETETLQDNKDLLI